MNPSGTGRFIADSWFSDEPLPAAYTHPAAKKVRDSGGVGAKEPDKASIDAYLAAVDVKGAIDQMTAEGKKLGGLRGSYFEGLGICFLACGIWCRRSLAAAGQCPTSAASSDRPESLPSPQAGEETRASAGAPGRASHPSGQRRASRRGRRLARRPAGSSQIDLDAPTRSSRSSTPGQRNIFRRICPWSCQPVPLANMISADRERLVLGIHELPRPGTQEDGSPEYGGFEINA
jgi:hypothetical protein